MSGSGASNERRSMTGTARVTTPTPIPVHFKAFFSSLICSSFRRCLG
jgi:hypothetical protein